MMKNLCILLVVLFLFMGSQFSKAYINDSEVKLDRELFGEIIVGMDGDTRFDLDAMSKYIDAIPKQELSVHDAISVLYIHDKELLSYRTNFLMSEYWSLTNFGYRVTSEENHLNLIHLLMERYKISDFVTHAENDHFLDPLLNEHAVLLAAYGSQSLVDGLIAVASIEENTILEIELLMQHITENKDIKLVFEHLSLASRNHLRSSVNAMSLLEHTYEPAYMSDQQLRSIISSPMEFHLGTSLRTKYDLDLY